MHSPTERLHDLCQQREEGLTVDVVDVDVDPAGAAGRYVEETVLREV
jgi:hypothetical protein